MSRGGARVSGGIYGRRTIRVPPGVRPTEGKVREALASIWGESIAGARCLDLFAGTGAVAIELCGRGAGMVVAIESVRTTVRALHSLAGEWRIDNLEVREARLPAGLGGALIGQDAFDLVFADPPYDFGEYSQLIAAVAPWLAEGGEFVLELSSRIDSAALGEASPELECWDQRRYGEVLLRRFRRRVSSG